MVLSQAEYDRLRQFEFFQNHSATLASSSGMDAYFASSSRPWILGLRASSQMIRIQNYFNSLHLSNIFSSVNIADGTQSTVLGNEVVHATPSLTLTVSFLSVYSSSVNLPNKTTIK